MQRPLQARLEAARRRIDVALEQLMPVKDSAKTTFVSLYGVESSRETAQRLVETAKSALSLFGSRAGLLRELADASVGRRH